ncbi:MAG: NAD-dependent epimerase/dehydratase family protein [Chitinophagales bacterium]
MPCKGLRMELFHGSILDPAFIAARLVVPNADVVFATAQISIYKHDEQKVAEINIAGTKNVLKAIQADGNKRLIHFSSIHAMDPFPRDQALNEQRPLRQSGTTTYDASKIAVKTNGDGCCRQWLRCYDHRAHICIWCTITILHCWVMPSLTWQMGKCPHLFGRI